MNIEQYLMTCGAEECGELAQAFSKAIRFGLDDQWPGREKSPRQDIKIEFNDLLAVIETLADHGILESNLVDENLIQAKKFKLARMMLYSAKQGRLDNHHSSDPSDPSKHIAELAEAGQLEHL